MDIENQIKKFPTALLQSLASQNIIKAKESVKCTWMKLNAQKHDINFIASLQVADRKI